MSRKAKAYEALAFQDERFKMREDVRVMLANQRISATRTSFQKKEEILHQFERLMVRHHASSSQTPVTLPQFG